MSSSNPLDALTQQPANVLEGRPAVSGNPLDQLSKDSTAPALPTAAPMAAVNGNPLDQLLIKPQAAPAAATAPTSSASNPLDQINPLDQLNSNDGKPLRSLTNEEAKYGQSDPLKMEDEPWYSKAWEWMNSPLYDLHKWGTREGAGTFERGLETGLEDIGSGFLSPLQLGLTIATFGGSAVEGAGLSALRSIGVTEKAAPIVVRGLKGLMTAGFSVDMLHGLVTQSPQFLDALKDGDVEQATRLGTNILATGVFLKEGLKHGIEDATAVKNYVKGKNLTTTDRLKLVADLAGQYELNKSEGTDASRTRMNDIVAQLDAAGVAKDDVRQAGIRHYINADGDLARIAKIRGIADGTIKPREYTAEEKATQNKAAELNKWAGESKDSVKNSDGSPKILFITDGEKGTLGLGQTLAASGEAGDEHYVQMKNPMEMRGEANLKNYIEDAGGEEAAKAKLEKAGFDGVTYGEGADKKFITFDDKQYRPVETVAGDPSQPWNREHVYYATDKKYRDQILNAGIKNKRRATVEYSDTPGEALKNAILPDSGNAKDLEVYAVPRAEVEKGGTGLVTDQSHMPGHLLEMDEKGQLTGRSKVLRPEGAEDLPGDNSRFNNQYTEAEKKKYLAGLDAAQHLTDEEKTVAKSLRQLYDNSFKRAHENGLIRQWVEAYHPQAWADDPHGVWNWLFNKDQEAVTNEALNQLRHDTNSGNFDTEINAAKHRAYSTEFEGVMAGEKFKSDDLAMHAFNHMNAIEHAIASRNYIDGLRAKGAVAQDGRPAVVMQGTTRVMGKGTDNPAVAIEPNAVKAIHISPEKVEDMQIIDPKTNMSPLEAGLKNGTIEKLPWTVDVERDGKPVKTPAYAYSTEGYESIDHPAMRGWGFSGVDTAGNPAIMHGNMVVHPDFADHVRAVMGAEKSVVRDSGTLRAINAVAGEGKGLLLSISPFHVIQEGLRAAMMGINPFKADHIDINTNETLKAGVKAGLVRNDFKAKDNFSKGYASHSKLISMVPGLNRFQGWMQEFLFDKYIPSLKDRAFIKMFDDLRDQHPGLDQKEIASRTADTINDVFGGQNWRKLGVSASQQDFARMFALAPDWLVSEMRMLGRASGVIGEKTTNAYARKAMVKQMAGIWLGARVINMLASGNMHNEAPFGVVQKNDKGEETVYSIRTLPTDLMHVLSDPEKFLQNRVNPLTVRPAVEFLSGRDALGRRATPDTQAKDLLRNVLPIAGQGLLKGGDLGNLDQLYKATGGNVYKYRTEAEKLAQQYASDRMPSGPVNKENLKHHQEDLMLEDALRAGQVTKGQMLQKISKRRVDEIVKRVHGGTDNGPMSPLQARFDRLPMSDAINVWDAATKSEKDELKSMLWKKRLSYIKQHTAAQRADDPAWRKLQSIYADLR
jgi:hypothetical protein